MLNISKSFKIDLYALIEILNLYQFQKQLIYFLNINSDIHTLFDQLGTLHEKDFNRIRQAKIIRYIQDRNDKKIPQNQYLSEEVVVV